MIHLWYHPHSLHISDKHQWISANRHHCLERYLALDRQLAFVADFFGCASSRHICACAQRRRPLQPLPSCFSRLAPPLLEGEGSHLQRPASDVFYPRFADCWGACGERRLYARWAAVFPNPVTAKFNFVSCCCCCCFFLRPLTRRSRPALEGPHGGRHLSVSADLRRVRADSAEPPETPLHEGRAPEQDVARGVRLLAAHGAPARRAVDIGALRRARTHAFLGRAAAAGIAGYWITCTARTHISRFWRAIIASSTDSGWPK